MVDHYNHIHYKKSALYCIPNPLTVSTLLIAVLSCTHRNIITKKSIAHQTTAIWLHPRGYIPYRWHGSPIMASFSRNGRAPSSNSMSMIAPFYFWDIPSPLRHVCTCLYYVIGYQLHLCLCLCAGSFFYFSVFFNHSNFLFSVKVCQCQWLDSPFLPTSIAFIFLLVISMF